jgi:hypothetical protein
MSNSNKMEKLMHVVSKCIQETELKNDSKEISHPLECAEEPRYNNIGEVINHYYECTQNNDWNNFNFQDACEWLCNETCDKLCIFGQLGEELYVTGSLDENFPGWTTLYPGHYHETGYGSRLAVQKAAEEGNRYCLFNDPLSACEEIETIWFRKLEKEYENDPDILNLKDIFTDLCTIDSEEGHGFSQEEMITLINKVLHAKHPLGPLFDLKE